MKKWLMLAGVGVLASAGIAAADNDIGCGWGTQAFAGKSGAGFKIMGVTTNHILGSQTFGITSGTAGCKTGGVIKADARTSMFASANINRLAREMAMGGGETLDTLAQLMGVDAADRPAFFQLTQQNFGSIISSDNVTAGEMLSSLQQLMAQDAQLSKYVTL